MLLLQTFITCRYFYTYHISFMRWGFLYPDIYRSRPMKQTLLQGLELARRALNLYAVIELTQT